jgi:hypothetical protein
MNLLSIAEKRNKTPETAGTKVPAFSLPNQSEEEKEHVRPI